MTSTTEEDTELRDLVAATLENSGVLGKIKAQLRANVYIALEEGNHDQECWTVGLLICVSHFLKFIFNKECIVYSSNDKIKWWYVPEY